MRWENNIYTKVKHFTKNTRHAIKIIPFWYKYFMSFIRFGIANVKPTRDTRHALTDGCGIEKKKLNLNGIMFYRKLRCLISQILHQDAWIIHKALRTESTKNEKSLNTGIPAFFIIPVKPLFSRSLIRNNQNGFFPVFSVHYNILSSTIWDRGKTIMS